MISDRLRHDFGYKPADESQRKSCVAIRTAFWHLATLVEANTPASHLQLEALADLQRACRTAIAAVVVHSPIDPASIP